MTTFARQFKDHARDVARDLRHRDLIQTALRKYEVIRDKTKAAFQDWPAARQTAAEIKWEAINHLDRHLESFASKMEGDQRLQPGKPFW